MGLEGDGMKKRLGVGCTMDVAGGHRQWRGRETDKETLPWKLKLKLDCEVSILNGNR